MKRIFQNLNSGETSIFELPLQSPAFGSVLIITSTSLVSLGTEKMLVDFGRANLLDKARQQPEKVKQVLAKAKTDGIGPTLSAVRSKLDQPITLGYCNAGVVTEAGGGVTGFEVGDRVLSNGPHAEMVSVPQNLCAKIPDNVSDEEATFGVVGAIALQGIRLIEPTLGERVVVTGLGLIGLLAVQILRANGCEVLGIDFDSKKCALAKSFGAEVVDLSKGEDPLERAALFSRGLGVDAVLITASTKSHEPVHQAAEMCRKRGRIVLVGVVGLQLNRSDFYEKELSFQVSCSYGPGRYDPNYEGKGLDYPFGLVRWTEQRNFEAVLGLMSRGLIQTEPLISHRYDFENAVEAYENLSDKDALGIILKYGKQPVEQSRTICLSSGPPSSESAAPGKAVVAVLGAGNFTGQVLLPALKATGAQLHTIVSSGGVSGTHFGRKFGFQASSTDAQSVLNDPAINTIIVSTRHNSHARYVLAALKAGKNVFVEKPLCLTMDELEEIEAEIGNVKSEIGNGGEPRTKNREAKLLVGFNRRFSPFAVKMKELLQSSASPKSIVYTVNAGKIPGDHWTQDPEVGGGRIAGEACHFIDFCRFLVGSPIVDASIQYLGGQAGATKDTASLQLKFADESIATVHYFANGSKAFPKERVEAFCEGRILQLDNFRKLQGYGWKGFKKMKAWSQQKGHKEELQSFVKWIETGGPAPIPSNELLEVSRISLELAQPKK